MKSRDERRADFERREAERKAKYAERMQRIRDRDTQLRAERDAQRDEDARRILETPNAFELGGTGDGASLGGFYTLRHAWRQRRARKRLDRDQ